MKPNEEKPLGCNKNLGRGSCGDISFANKIILCDDCVWKLIEENQKLNIMLKTCYGRIEDLCQKLINKEKEVKNKSDEMAEQIGIEAERNIRN